MSLWKNIFLNFQKIAIIRGFAPLGLFLVIFENIKKLVKSACKVFFCVVVYSKPEKWRPYKTAPTRAALDRSKKK